jgi:2-phospho-L-lactate guanylyltransferase
MLEHTLETLKQVPSIQEVFVITRDTAAIALARDHGVNTLQESSDANLIAGLTFATQVAKHAGAGAVLVVASDIPFLQAEDLEKMIRMAKNSTRPRSVIIGPDRHMDGTNAMLVTPPGAISYKFGEGSFKKHVAEAERVGALLEVYESRTLGLDVDYAEDLADSLALLAEGHYEHAADIRDLLGIQHLDQLGLVS